MRWIGLVTVLILAAPGQSGAADQCEAELSQLGETVYHLGSQLDQMGESGLIDGPEYEHWFARLTTQNGAARAKLQLAKADDCAKVAQEVAGTFAQVEAYIESMKASAFSMR